MSALIERTVDRGALVRPESLSGYTFTSEAMGHTFIITTTLRGEEQPISGTITGSFLRADNEVVDLNGTVIDGKAQVSLSYECYDVPGRFLLTIYRSDTGESEAIYSAVGTVLRADSETHVDTGIIPTFASLTAAQEAAEDAADRANDAAEAVEAYEDRLEDVEDGVSDLETATTGLSEDLDDLKDTLPTEETAEELLTEESTETTFLQFILLKMLSEINNSKSDIDEINEVLASAPTDEMAENILQALVSENNLLNVIQAVLSRFVEQQGSSEDTVRIPEYFEENVEAAITNYRKNAEQVGNNGDSFVFITDTHWGMNAKNSPALIHYLIKNTSLRNVFCGGDILDSGSKNSELAKGYDFMQAFGFVPGGLKTVIGNHDFNKNGHTEDSSYWFTLAQTYALFYPEAEMEIQDVRCAEPSTGYYEISYYVDVPATNTRYLFVSIPFGSVSQTTTDWVVSQLTNNPTKNFVMFSHFLMKNSQGEMAGGASSLMNSMKSFTNLKAWIFGHTHIDQVYYMSTGIPMICTDTDSSRLNENNPYDYTTGTITEQAFDVMTVDYTNGNVECARVGRGKNRRVNGGVNSVSVSGTLALTSTITPTSWESGDTTVATVDGGTVTGVGAGDTIIKASNAGKEEYWYVKVS